MRPAFRAPLGVLLLASVLLVACRQDPAPVGVLGPVTEGAARLAVASDGIYRLTQAEIAGVLDGELPDLSALRLSTDGQPVAFHVRDDAIVFYGQAPASRYTGTRAYLLEAGAAEPGVRMATVEATRGDDPPAETVPVVAAFEENRVYKSSAFREADGIAPWFWDTVQVQSSLSVPFELPSVAAVAAELSLGLWGATSDVRLPEDHDLDVLVNDVPLGTIRWDGEAYHQATLPVPAGVLRSGANALTLDNTPDGATFLDIMLLDRFEIAYQAPPVAIGDRFALAPGAAGAFSLSGFGRDPLLLDVSTPGRPLVVVAEDADDPTVVRFVADAGQRLVAAGPAGFLRPEAIAPLRATPWTGTDVGADLIIVTTDGLVAPLEPLVAAREAQGLRVAVLTVGEIYDGFGHGQSSPEAITAMLRHATASWAPPAPRYLLLVGEATYDYKDYLGLMPAHVVPPLLVPVEYSGETVSDARLADVDGDANPDLAVGRWLAAAVAALVERTLAYESSPAPASALFTADGTSAEFSSFSDRLLQSTAFPIEQVSRLYGSTSAEVIPLWNDGAWLVSYTGHGSTERWGKEDVFSREAVDKLAAEGASPIVVQFTCLSGFFAHPEVVSISERLLLHDGGPVLVVAATSLTLSSSQEPFANMLVQALLDPGVTRMGDALQQAKAGLDTSAPSLREVSDTFGLLGDPSAPIQRPPIGADS